MNFFTSAGWNTSTNIFGWIKRQVPILLEVISGAFIIWMYPVVNRDVNQTAELRFLWVVRYTICSAWQQLRGISFRLVGVEEHGHSRMSSPKICWKYIIVNACILESFNCKRLFHLARLVFNALICACHTRRSTAHPWGRATTLSLLPP